MYIYYFNGIYENSTERDLGRWCFHDEYYFNGRCNGGYFYSLSNYDYLSDFGGGWFGWGKTLLGDSAGIIYPSIGAGDPDDCLLTILGEEECENENDCLDADAYCTDIEYNYGGTDYE